MSMKFHKLAIFNAGLTETLPFYGGIASGRGRKEGGDEKRYELS